MTRPMRRAFYVAMLASIGLGATLARAGMPGTEATLAVEALDSGDVHLRELNLQADQSLPRCPYVFSATTSRIDIDYGPARYDILSQPMRRVEERTAAELTMRFRPDADFIPFAGGGGDRGFTDFRSVWLDEYYRQLFAGVPGYAPALPHGWHALAGGRWSYLPGSAILQGTLVRQDDTVSPGYEPQIGHPLLRGRERLRTTAVRVSTENVATPTVRTLLELGATNTTGRDTRYSVQGSVNWAISDTVTLRGVVAGVREPPAFHATSIALTCERDWNARWFAGLAVRGYRDSGEVIDPLIGSSAAPALRTVHMAACLRWQGERAAVRLEGGPYRTRYDNRALASAQFARLYRDRNWRRVQGTASWRF